ncbi:hypothetical protein EV175_005526 [Coemansia sp. RSA 1933]|nr:hypothetical protein EV175_005526 [Coemansia sp. RSA 1933]
MGGDYITDSRELLYKLEDVSGEASENEDNGDADDTPHYSMITGKLKQQRQYVDPRQSTESGSRDLVLANKSTEIAKYLGSAGAEYLLNISVMKKSRRFWQLKDIAVLSGDMIMNDPTHSNDCGELLI